MKRQKIKDLFAGFAMGVINALFGAGGGILTVEYLKRSGTPLKSAHATSVAIIMPLSLISAGIYLYNGAFAVTDCLAYLPGGALGAVFGAFFLKKIPDFYIKKIFALFIIYASVKLLLR